MAVIYLHHHPQSHAEEQAFSIEAAVLSGVLAEYRGDRLTVEPLSHSDRWSWSSSTYPEHGWFGFDAQRDDSAAASAMQALVVPEVVAAATKHMDDEVLLQARWQHMTNDKYLRNLETGIPFAGDWPTWVEAAVLAQALNRFDIFDRVVVGLASVSDDSRVSGPGYIDAELARLRSIDQR